MWLLLSLIVRKESNAKLMTLNWFIDTEHCWALWNRLSGNQMQCLCTVHIVSLYVNIACVFFLCQYAERSNAPNKRSQINSPPPSLSASAPWLFRMRRMYVKAIVFHIDLIFLFVSWLYFFSRIVLLSKCRAPIFFNGNEFWYINADITSAMVSVEFVQSNEKQLHSFNFRNNGF